MAKAADGKIAALREQMAAQDPPLDAYVIPSEDAHQSEYTADRDKRREYVSGFTGSAGVVLVTQSHALLWTDGRYFLQGKQQLKGQWKLMKSGEDPTLEAWLAENLPESARVGADPECVSVDCVRRWKAAWEAKKLQFVPVAVNLVDMIWSDRPPAPKSKAFVQPTEFAGKSVEKKLAELREKLMEAKADAIVLTALDEVAWLYNIRGADVDYNPVAYGYGLVSHSEAVLYMDEDKLDEQVTEHFSCSGVQVRPYTAIAEDLKSFAAPSESSKANGATKDGASKDMTDSAAQVENASLHKVWVNPALCSWAIYSCIPSGNLVQKQPSPVALAKALKHPVELQGMRNAHVRDGAAMVQFLAWLDEQAQAYGSSHGYFASEHNGRQTRKRKARPQEDVKLTEITMADKLESFRQQQEHFVGLSFPTISSVGANAAIIHYRPQQDKCAEFDPDKMYLCDSGAQYRDGTTDVTRTVHFGEPSAHERACFTKVLQGHIALDTVVFPNGTNGHVLDVLARRALWDAGLDYRHGTGHGVGSFLNVHEGPQLISFRLPAVSVPMKANMTITNEPGYYEDGNFGLRIENVMVVREVTLKHNFDNKGFLGFEHITYVPLQSKLMDLTLMSAKEMDWVDHYHTECREKLAERLDGAAKEWLMRATEPLSRTHSME
eukprot:jgi/Chlat1/6642/Chrsp49S06121